MNGYSLRNSNDPNILTIYCHQCKTELKIDTRLAKNLKPPPGMAWNESAGSPSKQELLWDRVISEHRPKCNPALGPGGRMIIQHWIVLAFMPIAFVLAMLVIIKVLAIIKIWKDS